MLFQEIIDILEGKLFLGKDKLDIDVSSACGSDLMSDVLCHAKENIVLLTGLNNCQVIRTADMAGIDFIALVRGKNPSEEVLSLAKQLDKAIISTELSLYEACGRLYSHGLGIEMLEERRT